MYTALSEAELRIMHVIWREGSIGARRVAQILQEEIAYSPTTTYTLISRCIRKGAVERKDPGYICTPIVSRQQVEDDEVQSLMDRLFDGSPEKMIEAIHRCQEAAAAEAEAETEAEDAE